MLSCEEHLIVVLQQVMHGHSAVYGGPRERKEKFRAQSEAKIQFYQVNQSRHAFTQPRACLLDNTLTIP